MQRDQREQGQRLVDQVLAGRGGRAAALGPEDCLWAGSMSALIDTLLLRDGTTLPGVL